MIIVGIEGHEKSFVCNTIGWAIQNRNTQNNEYNLYL